MTTPEVRLATEPDMPAVTAVLGRAFADDPFVSHVLPPDCRNRTERLQGFMALGATGSLGLGSLFTTAELDGAAAWLPPDKWKPPVLQQLRATPAILRTLGRRATMALGALTALEAGHPKEPHWYLEILGTDPPSQGKGIGGALMAPILERCDTEGLPAYLESSKEQNVPYYERFGFRVTEEVHLPKGGPTLSRMWRDPQG